MSHVKTVFGFTNADFREALYHAPAGIFLTEEDWIESNLEYGINPPLQMPNKKC